MGPVEIKPNKNCQQADDACAIRVGGTALAAPVICMIYSDSLLFQGPSASFPVSKISSIFSLKKAMDSFGNLIIPILIPRIVFNVYTIIQYILPYRIRYQLIIFTGIRAGRKILLRVFPKDPSVKFGTNAEAQCAICGSTVHMPFSTSRI